MYRGDPFKGGVEEGRALRLLGWVRARVRIRARARVRVRARARASARARARARARVRVRVRSTLARGKISSLSMRSSAAGTAGTLGVSRSPHLYSGTARRKATRTWRGVITSGIKVAWYDGGKEGGGGREATDVCAP